MQQSFRASLEMIAGRRALDGGIMQVLDSPFVGGKSCAFCGSGGTLVSVPVLTKLVILVMAFGL
jgi:hypothetical protein